MEDESSADVFAKSAIGGDVATAEAPPPAAGPDSFAQAAIASYQPQDDVSRRLSQAKEHYSANADKYWGQGTQSWYIDRIPGANVLMSIGRYSQLGMALKGLKEGNPSDDDLNVIAQHAARTEYEGKKSLGESAVDTLSHVPGLVAEFALTGGTATAAKEAAGRVATKYLGENLASRAAAHAAGVAAQTALLPSMYVDRAVHANLMADREPLDPRGLPGAYSLAAAQLAVLGATNKVTGKLFTGNGVGQAMGRIAVQAGSGPFAQAATDIVTSAVHLDTGYGTVGKLVRGDTQGAMKSALMDAMQFAAFGGAHEIVHGGKGPGEAMKAMEAFAEASRALKAAGVPIEKAGEALREPTRIINEIYEKDPEATRQSVETALGQLPDGPTKDLGLAIAKGLPEGKSHTPEVDRSLFQGLGIEPPKPPEPKPSPETAKVAVEPQEEAPPGRPPESPPSPPAPKPPDEPPVFQNARQEADWLEKRHLELLSAQRDALLGEKAAKDMVDKGFPKQKEYKDAVSRRKQIQKDLKQLQRQLDDARVRASQMPKYEAPNIEQLNQPGLDELSAQQVAESGRAESGPGDVSPRQEIVHQEPQGPTPGIDELATRQTPPAAGDLLERMRARAGVKPEVGQVANIEGGTRTPEVVPPVVADVSIKGMPLINQGVYDLTQLQAHERYLLDSMFGDGRSLRDLARDPRLPTLNTAESVKKAGVRALKRLGIDMTVDPATGEPRIDPDTGKPMKLTVANVQKVVAMEAKDRLAALGITVDLGDLMHKPDEVAGQIREELDYESARRQRWANYVLKEAKNGPSGRLSNKALAEIERAFDAGEEPPGYAPRRRARGEDAATARVNPEPTPVPASASGELQQNPASGAAAAGEETAAQQVGGGANAGGGPPPSDKLTDPFHPENLAAYKKEIGARDRADVAQHNEILREARQALEGFGGQWKMIHLERYEDANDVKGLDEVADDLARKHPEWFTDGRNPDDVLFDILKAGNRKPMTDYELEREARGQASYFKQLKETHDAAKEAIDAGFPASEVEEALRLGLETREAPQGENGQELDEETVAERRAIADQPTLGEPVQPGDGGQSGQSGYPTAGDFSDVPFRSRPAPWDRAATSPGARRGIGAALDTFVHDESASVNLDVLRDLALDAKEKAGVVWRNASDGIREMAGQSFPRAHRLAAEIGNALARLASSKTFVNRAIPYYIDKVMGPNASPELRRLWGATLGELRVRYAKSAWMAAGDHATAAQATSFIGMNGSPLTSEGQFLQVAASPEFREMLDRYRKEFVGVMETYFKKAQGIDPNDPISSFTQIPGLPVQFRAIREGQGPPARGVSARGSLKGQQARKLMAAEQAGLDAEQYDVDLGSIMENTLRSRVELANKADAYRSIVEAEAGMWRVPGAHRVQSPLGELVEIAGVRPPRGTQIAQPGQTSLYVKPEIESEVRKALDLNPKGPLTEAASIVSKPFTSLGLAATVEFAYHSLNQMTFAFTKPGVKLGDIWRNTQERWNNTPEMQKRLMDLAQIGALKPTYHDGAPSLLKWSARLLDGLGDVMRVTADDAFKRMVERGATNTEQNRRDFINQLGQYERRAQPGLVAWLRDSGIGPFATAGTNYLTQGVRSLWLDPGLKFDTKANALKARAEVLGKIATGIAITAAYNFIQWGRIDGDDKTPVGSIKLGESGNKSITMDLSGPFLWKRGLRSIGLLAMMEGERGGRQETASADRAVEDVMHAVLHPAMGPVAQTAKIALTGTNSAGMQVADRAKANESQAWRNLKAAAVNVSPLGPGALQTIGITPPGRQRTPEERIQDLLGPYGPKLHERPVASPVKGNRR